MEVKGDGFDGHVSRFIPQGLIHVPRKERLQAHAQQEQTQGNGQIAFHLASFLQHEIHFIL